MKIYVAGPMRARPAFNFPAFDDTALILRDMGHEVFNPAEHDRSSGFDPEGLTGFEPLAELPGFSLREALDADTHFICTEADAVVVLPAWEQSKGAKAEVALARALGLFVLRLSQTPVGKPQKYELIEVPA